MITKCDIKEKYIYIEKDLFNSVTLAQYNATTGTYSNPWSTWSNEIFTMKFMIHRFFHRSEPGCKPNNNCPNLNRDLPICHPQFQKDINEKSLRLTWLGHASVLFFIDGFHILCDPIFSQRCSISRHAGGFIRYRPNPCAVSDLPNLDFVLISHNHQDHLDMPTLELIAKFHPNALWCVPQGDLELISKKLKLSLPEGKDPKVVQFSWWDSFEFISSNQCKLKIYFTPAQHWSGRNLLRGRCKSLWGSWAILGEKHRAWFGGDTGYCSVFQEIGNHLGPFDLAAIPIGSYHPRWYLKYQHVDPYEAVKIHKDIRAKYSIGIHWGTFAFTWESYIRPKNDLDQALEKFGLTRSQFRTIHHGQSFIIIRYDENNNYYTSES